MNDFLFYSPTEFVLGRDTEARVGALVREYGGSRVMVVYGGGSAVRSGLIGRIETSLSAAQIPYTLLGGVQPNPVDTLVREGIALGRKAQTDFMLAVGGGSVIDTAKAIAAGIPYEGDFWDFFEGKATVTRALPVGVVLTIPAAGSEGSGNAVITRTDGLRKLSLRTPKALRPRFAVMNPMLTLTLPPYQTFAGIADMMVHVMERYFTPTEGVEVSDRLCEGLLMAIIHEARTLLRAPADYDARANIMWCGTVAHNGTCGVGRVEDWASHFIEHEVSALYGVTHGAGLTAIVPAWMRYVAAVKPEMVAQLGRRVFALAPTGDVAADAGAAIDALTAFFREIGMPTTLRELGVDSPDVDLLVRKLHENKGPYVGNYVRLDAHATRQILELARG